MRRPRRGWRPLVDSPESAAAARRLADAPDESDEMGAAIAQIVIANEMPEHSARDVMQEHARESARRSERGKIFWGRSSNQSQQRDQHESVEKSLSKLRELEDRLADKKGETSHDQAQLW